MSIVCPNTFQPGLIAYYLPQFHPIPENDRWWGPGFTEWTNVAKAKPLYRGHYQPHLPGELGFYDLRVPETRAAQAELARAHGIAAFCYYHYWFAGKQLLERPFKEVLQAGEPDFPFCLCWANESWSGVWHGCPERVLMQQTYPGPEDHERHFYFFLEAFGDPRYYCLERKPLLLVYSPAELPEPKRTTDQWRELATRAGLPGLYLVGVENDPWEPEPNGFDGATPRNLQRSRLAGRALHFRMARRWRSALHRLADIYPYRAVMPHLLDPAGARHNVFPCVIPNWDNTPRAGIRGLVLDGSSPALFKRHLRDVLLQIADKEPGHRIVFIKSWNEWGEGNYLEPDARFGRAYLEALSASIRHSCHARS